MNIARVGRAGDALHDLTADAVIFAGVGRQHIHALLARQPSDDRFGLRSAHLHGVENLVGHAGKRRLRE